MTSEHFAAQTPLNFGVTWIGEALSTVRAYRDTLNSLNAFPVPDQDTGSNLVHTLEALNKAFSEELDTLLHDLHALTTDIQSVNQRLGEIYENALVQASRMARGNSGTLLCAWALEAVRTYWNFPGRLAEELGEEAHNLTLLQELEAMYRETPVTETGTRESAYRESYALALAAERVRRIIADESLERGTMVAIMVALADYRFHYRAGSELTDVTARAEFRRATMRRALEGTAQNPPLPELKGYVDAGALGFYLAAVQSNPRWMSSRMPAQEVYALAEPPTDVTKPNSTSARKARKTEGTQDQAEHHNDATGTRENPGSIWEIMGTLTIDPLTLVQLRAELEELGDSLLLTPLDFKNNMWTLHVHVPSLEEARKVIAHYGVLDDERVSSLSAQENESTAPSCSQDF